MRAEFIAAFQAIGKRVSYALNKFKKWRRAGSKRGLLPRPVLRHLAASFG